MASRLARLLLALALVAGWQLALLHPLQHVDAQGGFVHLGDDHSSKGKPGSSDGLCDALAALAACAPEAPAGTVPLAGGHGSPASPDIVSLRAAEAPPFLSQGPPALL